MPGMKPFLLALVLHEKGKYVTIYARQADGTWKIIEDISNADEPAGNTR